MITVDSVVERLRALGYTVEEDFGPGPTEVMVKIDNERWLFACRDFNREDGGWEAVLDHGGDQEGLLDGPGADAEADEVAYWIGQHLTAIRFNRRTVYVRDLYKECSYPFGDGTAIAMSDCCRRLADSAVVVPAGSRFWRCLEHRGQINAERRGTPADMLAVLR